MIFSYLCASNLTLQRFTLLSIKLYSSPLGPIHWKHLATPMPASWPVMTQRILNRPARVEWFWVNNFNPNEYHIWHAWPSTCWHVENKSRKYEAPIFTAQTHNHWRKCTWRASVPKNGLPNWCDWILCHVSCMWGLYATCVCNRNWELTQDHFLIKHWSQRTGHCSASVVGLEEYSARDRRAAP